MTEFNKFYKDKRFYIPIIVLIGFELFFQLFAGFYKPYLKKKSYAANVTQIIGHITEKKQEHDPDILLIGTSVAYQGLSLPVLQEKIKDTGYKIQSVAIPGSELIVQSLAVEEVLKEFKNVKLVIYVGEITMPWVSKTDLTLPTLAMINEFDKLDAIRKVIEFDYESGKGLGFLLHYDDWAYLLFKSIAYRRDLNDFIVDPGKRLKYISRRNANPNLNFYEYDNDKTEKMSDYNISNLENCMTKTHPTNNNDPIPTTSNPDHKRAIFDTCWVAKYSTASQVRTPETELYFKRLSYIYSHIREKDIKIINIFAPYSNIIDNQLGGAGRVQVWKEELAKINPPNPVVVDFRNIFDGKNGDEYCYDVIHLNHNGAVLFSESLGEYLKNNLNELIKNDKN
jgi:hypothetical protein